MFLSVDEEVIASGHLLRLFVPDRIKPPLRFLSAAGWGVRHARAARPLARALPILVGFIRTAPFSAPMLASPPMQSARSQQWYGEHSHGIPFPCAKQVNVGQTFGRHDAAGGAAVLVGTRRIHGRCLRKLLADSSRGAHRRDCGNGCCRINSWREGSGGAACDTPAFCGALLG